MKEREGERDSDRYTERDRPVLLADKQTDSDRRSQTEIDQKKKKKKLTQTDRYRKKGNIYIYREIYARLLYPSIPLPLSLSPIHTHPHSLFVLSLFFSKLKKNLHMLILLVFTFNFLTGFEYYPASTLGADGNNYLTPCFATYLCTEPLTLSL